MEDVLSTAGIFGFFAFVVGLWRMQLKTNRLIYWAEVPHSILWAVHLFLIGGISGSIVCGMSFFRTLGRLYLKKEHFSTLVIILTICVWGVCLYFYQGLQSLIPPIGTTIISYGMLSDERRVLSNAILLNCFLCLVYGLSVGSTYQVIQMVLCISTGMYGKVKHENFDVLNYISALFLSFMGRRSI